MLHKTGLSLLRRVLPSTIVEGISGRVYVHKDFHAPDWDLKRHRVAEIYDDGRAGQMEFKLRNRYRRNRWQYYDQVVWKPDYEYPDGEPKTGEVFHAAHSVKHSHLKLFYACHMIMGRSVDDALKQLQFVPRKCAVIMSDVLKEAVDKAVNEHYIEYRSNLWVAEAFAQKTMVVQGIRRHARERWSFVEYPYSDVYIRLQEGQPPPYMGRSPDGRDGYYDGRKHLDALRSRRIRHGL